MKKQIKFEDLSEMDQLTSIKTALFLVKTLEDIYGTDKYVLAYLTAKKVVSEMEKFLENEK